MHALLVLSDVISYSCSDVWRNANTHMHTLAVYSEITLTIQDEHLYERIVGSR